MILKPFLLFLKIIAAIAIGVTGILGILGDSTDEFGNLTNYGKVNLYILILAILVAIVTYVVEHYNDEKKEKDEKELLSANIARQNTILKDIQRSFYKINSIDFLIRIDIPADSDYLKNYKKKLDNFLDNLIESNSNDKKEFEKKLIKVIFNTDPKLKTIHPIYSIIITADSPLFPKNDFLALSELSPVFDILLTDSIEFKELYNLPKELPMPSMHLNRVSDMGIYAPTLYENPKSSISYSPTLNKFSVTTSTEKALIAHDNGKIISILDLPNKFLVLFSSLRIRNFELKELRIQFNKSESKNRNSWFSISHEECHVIEGPMWQALVYKLPPSEITNEST